MLYTTSEGIQKEIEELQIDLVKGLKSRSSDIKYKRGDRNSRQLVVQLVDGSTPFDLSKYHVRLYALKPDGTKVWDDCEINDVTHGVLSITLKEQFLSCVGTVNCEFLLTAADDSFMATPTFKIKVEESINDENAIESTNEFRALLNAIDTVDNLDNKMELLKSETNKKLDALSNKTYRYSVADFKTNENTWEQAIQTCFDTVKDEFGHVGSEEQPQNGLGATIFFPKGTYSFNEVVLSAYGVTLTGEGVIDGTIKVSNSQIYWLDVKFEGLSFIHKTKKNSIVFENTRRIQVTRCNFINSDCCIKFLWGDTSLMQSCNKIDISNNNMHSCSYGVYIDERENSYRVGDIIVSNNRIQSTITCLHLPSCDGAMINNNVMFNRDGEHCIYSNFCNFFKISENNLFESGAECINIKQFMNVTISNNNIAWSGQLKMTPAIHLSDYDLGDSTKFNNSIVSGNNFDRPSGSALKLRNVGGINVVGNNILNAGSDTFYRGVGIPILESTNVFDVDSTVVNSFFTNNNSPYNPLNGLRLSDGLNNNRRDGGFTNNAERITISDNNAVSTIEVHGITSEIVFNPYQYSKIATINGGVRGQFLTIYCFAEGHSVTNAGNIVLAEGTDEVNIPKGKSITFRNVYEKWREVSRDF